MDNLGIQWKILLAQTVSFSLVFFVLWKFAYRPIFAMLETRREKIAEGLANAEKIKAELAHTEAERKRILAQAGDQANQLIEEARAAAAHVREVETQKAVAAAEQAPVVKPSRRRRSAWRGSLSQNWSLSEPMSIVSPLRKIVW